MKENGSIDLAPVVTDELRQAFRRARYRFDTPGSELLLQVDHSSEALQRLLVEQGQSCAAAITAHNPGGQQRDADSNQRAQRQLEGQLRALGLTCFAGRHEDPSGHWPAESSMLVLGLTCDAASVIAAGFGQLAILWSDAAGIPRLVETSTQQAGAQPR